jgi:hypothetical protein
MSAGWFLDSRKLARRLGRTPPGYPPECPLDARKLAGKIRRTLLGYQPDAWLCFSIPCMQLCAPSGVLFQSHSNQHSPFRFLGEQYHRTRLGRRFDWNEKTFNPNRRSHAIRTAAQLHEKLHNAAERTSVHPCKSVT